MATTSSRGIAAGVSLALVVPVSYAVLAAFIQTGLIPNEPLHGALNDLTQLGLISLFGLGPIGIVIAGWSAGVRSVLTWASWLIVAVPIHLVTWAIGAFALSGALGNPF